MGNPVPIQVETLVEVGIPKIKAKTHIKRIPIYLPRFVEVPCDVNRLPPELQDRVSTVHQLNKETRKDLIKKDGTAASLCSLENRAHQLMSVNAPLLQAQMDDQHLFGGYMSQLANN